MPIQIICPGCHKRFKVSEQYAGKQGPCPNCKAQISIPLPSEEVVVHAPENFDTGGRDTEGKLVLKPIERSETKLSMVSIVGIVAAIVAVLAIAWLLRSQYAGGEVPAAVLAMGAILLAPPLVLAGYAFLRDDELEPYRGGSLWIRAAICSVVYAALWGIYAIVSGYLFGEHAFELWEIAVVVPPILVIGAVAALASLELDFGSGFFHYGLYVLATVLLRMMVGMTPI